MRLVLFLPHDKLCICDVLLGVGLLCLSGNRISSVELEPSRDSATCVNCDDACCTVPVFAYVCGEVMMLWRMRDGVFPSPCVCLLCVARRYLYQNQISSFEAGAFAGLGNLTNL